jgi:Peptidase family M1 domain
MFFHHSEDVILFNPLVSPSSKEFAISKLITNGIVAQFLGNLVSFNAWSDVWIFRGLTKFLEYYINVNDMDFASNELFISEVLHPTLEQQFFPKEFPLSVDDALSKEVAEKGEKLQLSMSLARCENLLQLFPFFSAACTFRMIYYAIEREAFSQTLKRLIDEK